MPNGKPLYGIYLDKSEFASGSWVAYFTTPGVYSLSRVRRGERFVTNKAINRKLGEIYASFNGSPVFMPGSIQLEVLANKKLIKTSSYYPIPKLKGIDIGLTSILENCGLAELAELAVERELLKKYPDFSITTQKRPWAARVMQIIRRGRKVGEAIPLREAYRKTLEQAQKQYWRNKPVPEVEYIATKEKKRLLAQKHTFRKWKGK